jgi:hypothetical protein
VWLFQGQLEIEDGTGYDTLPWHRRHFAVGWLGYGIRVWTGQDERIHDLTRQRAYDFPRGEGPFRPAVWVLDHEWLVGDRLPISESSPLRGPVGLAMVRPGYRHR